MSDLKRSAKMKIPGIKIFVVTAIVYPILAGGLAVSFGLFSAWGFGMSTFPDLTRNSLLFPSLIFSQSDNIQRAFILHSIISGLLYATCMLLVSCAYRLIEKFRTGQ
jgi:hypothetical protein